MNWRWIFCKLGKHVPDIVYEDRPVYRGSWFPAFGRKSGSRHSKKFSHYKTGYYYRCKYCGKKLSNFINIKKQ